MSVNEVERLLLSIGREIGKSEDDMREYIDIIINKNWYDKIELLKDITNDQWESMNIPLRLTDIIRKRIEKNSVEGSEWDRDKSRLKEDFEWKFEYLTPENIEITPSLYNSVESLNSIDREGLRGVTNTLFKIIDSIIKEPRNGKIRRIRVNNPKFASTVGKYNQALDILRSVGFVEAYEGKNGQKLSNDDNGCESYIELPIAYISRLTDCHHLLASLCEKKNIEYPKLVSNDNFIYSGNDSVKVNTFNPYISNISSTCVDSRNESSKRIMQCAVEERYKVETEIKKREKDIETGFADNSENVTCSKPIAFHSSELVNKSRAENSLSTDKHDKDQELDAHYLDKSEIQKIKDAIDGKNSTFKCRSNEYLKSLQSKKIHSHSCIRVVFPDKYILQLEFRPNNTTHDLVEAVRDCINPNIASMNWFIYQSPPIVKITPDKKMLLIKAGFVPNAQLYFKLELPPNHKLEGNYIKSELIANKKY